MTLRCFGYFETNENWRMFMIFYAKDRGDLNKQLEEYAQHFNNDAARTGKIKPYPDNSHFYFHVCDPRGDIGVVD